MGNPKTPGAVDQFKALLEAGGHKAEVLHRGEDWFLQANREGLSGLRWVVQPRKGAVYLGAQINKGLDRSALGYSPSIKLVMQKHWTWMMAISELVASIQEWSGAEVNLQLANGMEPGFVPETSGYRHNFTWTLHEGRLHLVRPVYDASAAGEIAKDETLGAVIEHLTSLPEYRWLWARLQWGQSVAAQSAIVDATIRDMITRFGVWYSNAPQLTNSAGGSAYA